jgi:dCMP deaminase
MGIAFLSAMRSKDPSTTNGACIVNQDKIIVGIGYNGFPKFAENNDEIFPWERDGSFLDTKYPYVCHAEMNAIMNSNQSLKDCEMYCTLFPCEECAKLIAQSGIKKVYYYSDKYKGTEGNEASKRILNACNIETIGVEEMNLNFINFDYVKGFNK